MNGSHFRYRLVLLMLIVIMSFASACSGVPESNGPEIEHLLKSSPERDEGTDKITLKMWSFHTSKEFEFWQWLAKKYEEDHPGIEIKVEYISSDIYFSGTRLLAPFASGHGPDIFFVSSATIRRFSDASLLYPLTRFFKQEIKEDFHPAALESVTMRNEISAIPIETELLGLFYNKQMFSNRGLRPPATWDDMMAAAEALQTKHVSGLTVETFDNVYQIFAWLPFLWQTGADLLTPDGAGSAFSGKGALEMYAFFREMEDLGLINMQPSRPTTDIGIIANNETAMQISGSWNVRLLETEYADKPIGVAPLPVPAGGSRTTIAGGWKIAANNSSVHAEEAAKFIMWAFAGDYDIPLKWCTEVKFAYSPRKSVMEAGEPLYSQGLRAVFTHNIFGTERQEPQYPEQINLIFSESLQQLLYGDEDPETIVRTVNERIQSYLAES